ncbi:MAG: rod shape-determining protein MreC [Phycisphaerae bacterium]|jgi:cell shape-determining protein MreC
MSLLGRITKRRTLAALIALSVVTTVLGHPAASRLQNLLSPLLAPFRDVGMYLTVTMRQNMEAAGAKGLTLQEQEKLHNELDTLRGYTAYWKHEAEKTQEQLDALQKFQKSYSPVKDLPCELIPARVVGEASLPYTQERSLNVGQDGGAQPGEWVLVTDRSKALPSGLAVVSASALVGRVTGAGAFSAQVQLVTDHHFKTAARIRRIPDPGHPREIRLTAEGNARIEILNEKNNRPIDVQAAGDGAGGLTIADVWRYDNVQPGDLVVTAEDKFLPLEVRIGRVQEVRPDPMHPDRVIIAVRPEADLSTLRNVFVVNNLPEHISRSAGGKK